MKKLLIGLLCLAVCGTMALTSCKEEKVEEAVAAKTPLIDLTDDYEEKIPVFEYNFGGREASLKKYSPENAEKGEELPTDIVLPANPVRIKAVTAPVKTVELDGQTVEVKEKVEEADDKIYELISIEASAFAGNTEITSIVIPDTVTSIGEGAFLGCTSLKSVTLSANLEEIGDFAFAGCTSLESINIPDSVKSIGIFAFGEYFDQIPWYKNLPAESIIVGDGILLKYNGTEASVTYGDEVKYVSYYAFTDSPVTAITFANPETEFNGQAFYRCDATVYLPSSSTKVNELKLTGLEVKTFDAAAAQTNPADEEVEGEEAVESEEATESEEAVEGEEAAESEATEGEEAAAE